MEITLCKNVHLHPAQGRQKTYLRCADKFVLCRLKE